MSMNRRPIAAALAGALMTMAAAAQSATPNAASDFQASGNPGKVWSYRNPAAAGAGHGTTQVDRGTGSGFSMGDDDTLESSSASFNPAAPVNVGGSGQLYVGSAPVSLSIGITRPEPSSYLLGAGGLALLFLVAVRRQDR